ncbi:MAG: SpaA isopeptide-forming pilin-related protein [Christensenellales bacterium]
MTRIRIKKRDKDEYAQTDAPSVRGDGELTGATFRVLAGADILDRQGNVIWLRGATVIDAIQTSGEDAAATTDELWPGLYEIVEIAPPVGYLPSGEHVLVDTASAAAVQGSRRHYDALKLNEIKLGAGHRQGAGDNKTDNQHTETPEEGAEFHVYLRKAGSYENAREFERDHLITDKSGYAKPTAPYGVCAGADGRQRRV